MKRTRNLKLPNGFGSIIFLGARRTNPYGAIKTIGWDENGKQIKKYIGYGKSWNDAYEILLEYNKNPYDINNKNINLEEVYLKVEDIMHKELDNKDISESSYKAYLSSWNCHLKALKNKNMQQLRRNDIQYLIDNSGLKYTGRNYIYLLWKKIIKYCKEYFEMSFNNNICDIKLGKKEKSDKHKIFTKEEIEKIKEYSKFNKTAKILMIYFYTGVRPSELLNIKRDNVFIEENYMIGGIKNEISKNRIIPIHQEIKEIIKELYNEDNPYLFMNDDKKTKMTYDSYRHRFDKLMHTLGFEHTAHDTRHTFATKCDEAGIRLDELKTLMGHSQGNDVTNSVYIHRSKERLLDIINKLHY